jgi:hypothetical protein
MSNSAYHGSQVKNFSLDRKAVMAVLNIWTVPRGAYHASLVQRCAPLPRGTAEYGIECPAISSN